MRFPTCRAAGAVVLFLALLPTNSWAHWCDDLWSSAYDIVIKPDSDTSPKALYVENRWGYQLINFKLTATTTGGGSVTLTPPTTLKVPNTLLPGEKAIWKIASGSPAKVEDLSYYVTFGNTTGSLTKQYACYPVLGASPVMVVKNDGTLFPNAIAGIPKDGTDPQPNVANGCTFGDVALGRSLQLQTVADWDDLNAGLDNLMTLYCAGRGSWGNNDKAVKPNSYCKNATSTTCPTTRPTASPASRSDYMRLWGAGALAIRKSSLGSRLSVLRDRLKCGANDGDPGVAGYTLFVLGYLGDDSSAKSFLQTQANTSGDVGTIAKAALYLMGDTTQKAAVQAGVQSSSVWVKVACAGALGIVDKDDASVTSAIIPEVKWIEPDNMGGETDNGKGMYSAHILEIVAMHRRGWIPRGDGDGAVTFYGETGGECTKCASAGGASGSGGTSGAAGAGGSTSAAGSGGGSGRGGGTGSGGSGSGGTVGNGGATPSSTTSSAAGGSSGSGGNSASGGKSASGGSQAAGSSDHGGSSEASGGNSGMAGVDGKGQDNGCACNVGGQSEVPTFLFPALAGLALLLVRRRKH
jgi:MYXO-CTERM domain-containing protein